MIYVELIESKYSRLCVFVLKYSLFYIDSIVYSESTHLEYDIYNSCQHMLLWFGRCVIVCVCVKIFKEVNEWTAGVVGFRVW